MSTQILQVSAGRHSATAVLTKLLAANGIEVPSTGLPFSEAMLFGLAGGIGNGYSFCPSIPRYGSGGGVSVIGRHLMQSTTFEYHENLLRRLNVEYQLTEAATPGKAFANLREQLAAGGPVAALCAATMIPAYHTISCNGCSMHTVLVHSIDEARETAMIGECAPEPFEISLTQLAHGRNAICSQKNRTLRAIRQRKPVEHKRAIIAGIKEYVAEQHKPRQKTFSLDGLAQWEKQIANGTNAKGWLKVFDERLLPMALFDVFHSIETNDNGGGLFRPLFAEFLEQSAGLMANEKLAICAKHYRLLGGDWTKFAEACLPNAVPQFAKIKNNQRKIAQLYLQQGAAAFGKIEKLQLAQKELQTQLNQNFPYDRPQIAAHLQELRKHLSHLIELEQQGLNLLERAI